MKQAPYSLFAKARLETVPTTHTHSISSPSPGWLKDDPRVDTLPSLGLESKVRLPKVGSDYEILDEQEDEKEDNYKLLRQLDLPKALVRDVLVAKGFDNMSLKRNSYHTSGKGWMDYHLTIVTVGTVSILSGTSITNVYVSDPSAIPLSQWTTWGALFDEVKLDSLSVALAPYGDTSKVLALAVGNFPSSISTPSTITSVVVGAHGKLLSPLMTRPHVQHMSISDLVFASTAAPSATAGAGCPGSIKLYLTGTTTGGMLTFMVTGRYHLRGRQ